MKKCKSCQKEIDAKAKKCPYCQNDQRNWFMKHKIITAILILVILGLIGSMGSDSKRVGSATQSSNTKEQLSQETYKIGDKVQMSDIILTVNEVETAQGGQYSKPSEGNQWIDVNMTLENTGSSQQYITTMGQMFVIDDDNNQYQVAVTGKRLENAGSLGMDGALIAKAKKTEWVGFEVPKTAKGLRLQYNASFYSNKKILVDLEM